MFSSVQNKAVKPSPCPLLHLLISHGLIETRVPYVCRLFHFQSITDKSFTNALFPNSNLKTQASLLSSRHTERVFSGGLIVLGEVKSSAVFIWSVPLALPLT